MIILQHSSSRNNTNLFGIYTFKSYIITYSEIKENLDHNIKIGNNKNILKRSEMRILNFKSRFLRRRNLDSSFSIRPQPEEAQKWSESFNALMASKYGSTLFRAFLLREFSNENLDFWLAVEEYKNSKPQKMAAKAMQIFRDFIAVKASKQVNLDAETRLLTLTNIQQSNIPDQYAFDRAQRQTQYIMERDSYARFLQSGLFLELAYPERY